MVFDVIVGNPPYSGHWDPLYMQITKSVYDNNMDDRSVLCLINPTSAVDSLNETDPHCRRLREKYSGLRLSGFMYDESLRSVFQDVGIVRGVGIFIFSKRGLYTLTGEFVRYIRFGGAYSKDTEIIGKISECPAIDLKDTMFVSLADIHGVKRSRKVSSVPSGWHCLLSVHRGHVRTDGNYEWDWPTLITRDNLVPRRDIPDGQWNIFTFNGEEECRRFIEWLDTDLVLFVIMFYKKSVKNPKSLLKRIPEPPQDGDFSDATLMGRFGLSEDDMAHIHERMVGYGWKNTGKIV